MPDLATRIEAIIEGRGEIRRSRFLSGEAVFLDDRMVAAVIDGDLCLRRGLDGPDDPEQKNPRPFQFAGRPVAGWVLVDGGTVADDAALGVWLESAL